jgi:2,4-dienoyl-CoA reductase-like NADH-dependent reductase (Old Yellow Enzyme family)
VHEFLSPIANRRDDAWGGSFDNRVRLVVEIVRAVRRHWPEQRPLFVRLSSTDWIGPDGWEVEDSIALARRLASEGVDLIDCSSGGIAPRVSIDAGPRLPGRQRRAHPGRGPPSDGGHRLSHLGQPDEHVLRTGQADMVFLARALLRDPYWPLHAATELGVSIPWPPQYERARPR